MKCNCESHLTSRVIIFIFYTMAIHGFHLPHVSQAMKTVTQMALFKILLLLVERGWCDVVVVRPLFGIQKAKRNVLSSFLQELYYINRTFVYSQVFLIFFSNWLCILYSPRWNFVLIEYSGRAKKHTAVQKLRYKKTEWKWASNRLNVRGFTSFCYIRIQIQINSITFSSHQFS